MKRDQIICKGASADKLLKALTAPPAAGCELILSTDRSRLVAIIIPSKISIAQIELLHAIGERGWKDCCRLLRPWNCWAVLADEDWANDQVRTKSPRPTGFKLFFGS